MNIDNDLTVHPVPNSGENSKFKDNENSRKDQELATYKKIQGLKYQSLLENKGKIIDVYT